MGASSIWHFLILTSLFSGIAGFLPLLIKPNGPNRFGPSARPLNPIDAVITCMRKLVDFSGRGGRSEYWWMWLLSTLVSAASIALDLTSVVNMGVKLVSFVLGLTLISAGVRRLHDLNRSGWWMLLLLSGIGAIGLIVLLAWPSQADTSAEVF